MTAIEVSDRRAHQVRPLVPLCGIRLEACAGGSARNACGRLSRRAGICGRQRMVRRDSDLARWQSRPDP